jgi:hypothetical protein
VRSGVGLLWLVLLVAPGSAEAAARCMFSQSAAQWTLQNDCATDHSITVPDGVTLDGNHHTIVAVDPANGFFHGGVVVNGGASANVVNLTITSSMLADICQAGDYRLRAIYFDGASGAIRGNTIVNVNKPSSACQEGNGIEVRNRDRQAAASTIEISGNVVEGFQKTGIIASGNVEVTIRGNSIGPSAAQAQMAANGIQVGPGARALVDGNTVTGNAWSGANAAATAILLLDSGRGTVVRGNAVIGNADVGIYIMSNGVRVERNRLTDSGADGSYDVGIGNYGDDNEFEGNTIRGYGTASQGVDEPGSGPTTVAALQ